MLIERTEKGAKWTWSTLRPGPVIGTGLGGTMNLLLCIAGFGVFAKEYGIDMRCEAAMLVLMHSGMAFVFEQSSYGQLGLGSAG